MRTENHNAIVGHFVEFIDENRAALAQIIDNEFVVHDFMAHIDRRTEHIERAIDDFDGAIDTGAKAARIGETNLRHRLLFRLVAHAHLYSGRLHIDNFDFEINHAAGERMIEIHHDFISIKPRDNAGQLRLAGIGEGNDEAFVQLHRRIEIAALEMLHIVRIGLTEGFFGRHGELLARAARIPNNLLSKPGQQTAVADGECRRLFVEGRINDIATRERQGEVQSHFAALTNGINRRSFRRISF